MKTTYRPGSGAWILICAALMSAHDSFAACDECVSYDPAGSWGTVNSAAITEASGMVASRINAGVLWAHNDGSKQRVFAISTNGTQLASYNLNLEVFDIEDAAIGVLPGGEPALYFGDIGANAFPTQVRREVQIIRAPEPTVDLGWGSDPKSGDMKNVEVIRLRYPDASYDAEALFADPRSPHVYIATKQDGLTRIYRADMGSATNGALLDLEFVRTVIFDSVSAGDISADGTRIILRREDAAAEWYRCDGETISTALSRPGKSVPLPSLFVEPNGEAVAYAPDRAGYFTLGEGTSPQLQFVPSTCPRPLAFTLELTSKSVFEGARVEFRGQVTGFPLPKYSWTFKGVPISGATSNVLIIPQATSATVGRYELTASNVNGVVTSAADLTIDSKPLLRITEVQSSTAPSPNVPSADWWELTNFENQPVDISGWRFNDASGDFTDSFRIPSGVVLQPGESIVLAEELTPTQFRNWWGAGVPPRTQVIEYAGSGLSLAASGDSIRLWTGTATDLASVVARADFGAADSGITFNFNPTNNTFGQKSQIGVNGVFRALASADIGSPGRINALPGPVTLKAVHDGFALRVQFQAQFGTRYRLQSTADLSQGWTFTGAVLYAASTGPAEFSDAAASSFRFYRVVAD